MSEKSPTYSINEAFEYVQKIRGSYSFKPGSPEREFVNREDANRYAITLLIEKGSWRYSDSQYSSQVENALITLYDHVGHDVKTMYRMIKTLDKIEEFRHEASRMWIPDYAERLKRLHYDLNGSTVWLSENLEHRFSDARVRLWDFKEKLDMLASYKSKVEQEGFECFYLCPTESFSLDGLFSDPQGNNESESGKTSELYLVVQNRYDPSRGWVLTGHLEIEEATQESGSQSPIQHKVSDNILFHTPDEKLRILSGVPMKLPLLPSGSPIMLGVRTAQGILDNVNIKTGGNVLFVSYPKE